MFHPIDFHHKQKVLHLHTAVIFVYLLNLAQMVQIHIKLLYFLSVDWLFSLGFLLYMPTVVATSFGFLNSGAFSLVQHLPLGVDNDSPLVSNCDSGCAVDDDSGGDLRGVSKLTSIFFGVVGPDYHIPLEGNPP